MKIYRIKLDQGDLSPVNHHVLAKDFKDAEDQPEKILAYCLESWEEAEIREIALEFEIEVVK